MTKNTKIVLSTIVIIGLISIIVLFNPWIDIGKQKASSDMDDKILGRWEGTIQSENIEIPVDVTIVNSAGEIDGMLILKDAENYEQIDYIIDYNNGEIECYDKETDSTIALVYKSTNEGNKLDGTVIHLPLPDQEDAFIDGTIYLTEYIKSAIDIADLAGDWEGTVKISTKYYPIEVFILESSEDHEGRLLFINPEEDEIMVFSITFEDNKLIGKPDYSDAKLKLEFKPKDNELILEGNVEDMPVDREMITSFDGEILLRKIMRSDEMLNKYVGKWEGSFYTGSEQVPVRIQINKSSIMYDYEIKISNLENSYSMILFGNYYLGEIRDTDDDIELTLKLEQNSQNQDILTGRVVNARLSSKGETVNGLYNLQKD